jgi:hypothetical protein
MPLHLCIRACTLWEKDFLINSVLKKYTQNLDLHPAELPKYLVSHQKLPCPLKSIRILLQYMNSVLVQHLSNVQKN